MCLLRYNVPLPVTLRGSESVGAASAAEGNVDHRASRTRTQMKMLREVQNERFTFEIDSENALVGHGSTSTLER
jgi:hypothetical protein